MFNCLLDSQAAVKVGRNIDLLVFREDGDSSKIYRIISLPDGRLVRIDNINRVDPDSKSDAYVFGNLKTNEMAYQSGQLLINGQTPLPQDSPLVLRYQQEIDFLLKVLK